MESARKDYTNLPRHQREHAPTQIFPRVSGVAFRFRGQHGAYLCRHFVARIGFQPSTHGEPFCGLVAVPSVLIRQDHFNHVVVEPVKKREELGQLEKVCDRIGLAPLGDLLRLGKASSVGLTDQD